MNICILGAGSIGCFTGLLLGEGARRSGQANSDRIVLLGRRKLQLRFQNGGFSLKTGDADVQPPDAFATLSFEIDHSAMASADIVLVCVKSADKSSWLAWCHLT